MPKFRSSLRTFSIVAVALASVISLASTATAATKTTAPKLYAASVSESAGPGLDQLTIDVTILNEPGSSAVLGSANIVVPPAFNPIGAPAITFSSGKAWSVSTSGTTTKTIKLRAVGDMQKLSPGQWVTVEFTATKPAGGTTNVFTTAAKASRDFSGSSSFTLVGGQPALFVCPDTGDCTLTLGDINNPARDHQAGQVTVTDCPGCILTIREVQGGFCDTDSESAPSPPNTPCQTNFGPGFILDSNGNSGTLTIVIACNVADCPIITGGGGTAGADFYPVFIDYNDSPGPSAPGDFVQIVDQFCDGYYVTPPCLDGEGTGRFGDNNAYRSTLIFPFGGGGGDPRTLH